MRQSCHKLLLDAKDEFTLTVPVWESYIEKKYKKFICYDGACVTRRKEPKQKPSVVSFNLFQIIESKEKIF